MHQIFRYKIIFLFLLLPLFSWAQKDVSFSAKVNAKQVFKGDNFQVFFTLSNAEGKNFKAPDFKGFALLSGKNVSQKASAINGVWTKEITYSYFLQPKKTGRLTIGPASISIGGKTYKTKPVSIQVLERKNNDGSKVDDADKIFARAILNTNEAVPGQQVILDYKLYFSVDIDRYGIVEEPSFSGLFVSQIRRFEGHVIKEVIDGKTYGTKLIKRLAVYPQQSGKVTIDPITFRVAVPLDGNTSNTNTPFSLLRPTQSYIVETEPVELDVKPIKGPVPASFSGAVGSYTSSAILDKTVATTDDAITLSLTVAGDGDIKRVTAPELILSDTFEVYDPNMKDESQGERNGVLFGKKTFEYLILPKVPGVFQITPEFSYYDADSSKFVVQNPATFTVNIRKGKNNTNVNIKPVEPVKPKEEILGIKEDASIYSYSNFTGSLSFWILFGLPFLILGGGVFYKYLQAKKPPIDLIAEKSRLAQKVAKEKLSLSEKYLKEGNLRSFYDETSKALLGYVSDKFNIPGSELSKNNVQQHLLESKANPQHVDRFMDLIKTCEQAIFAGGTDSDANQVYQNAIQVIADIEM